MTNMRYAPYMQNLWYFLEKISFVKIYALSRKIRFVVIYALLCGENLSKNFLCGEKMTNIRPGKKFCEYHVMFGSKYYHESQYKGDDDVNFSKSPLDWKVKMSDSLESQGWNFVSNYCSLLKMWNLTNIDKERNKYCNIL